MSEKIVINEVDLGPEVPYIEIYDSDLVVSDMDFRAVCDRIGNGAGWETDEETIKRYIADEYQRVLGASANYPKPGPSGEDESTGSDYFSRAICSALSGKASWAGIVNDFLGITGHNPSHAMVAHNLHGGALEGVMTKEQALAFLVRIGVPQEAIDDFCENEEQDPPDIVID